MILHSKIHGEGKAFLILHGLFGMGDNWGELGRRWAKEGLEVHLIDLRNHGKSPQSNAMDYELISGDILNYINYHKLDDPIALGHSLGGKALMHFAVLYPSIFEKVIIADIAPKAYPSHHQKIFDVIKKVDFNQISNRKGLDIFLAEFISDESIRALLLKNTYRREDGKLSFLFYLEGIEKNYTSLIQDKMEEGIYRQATLFLRGKNSDYILDEDLLKIYKHFPKAKILKIENAGHWLHADNPEEVYVKILDFIGS